MKKTKLTTLITLLLIMTITACKEKIVKPLLI